MLAKSLTILLIHAFIWACNKNSFPKNLTFPYMYVQFGQNIHSYKNITCSVITDFHIILISFLWFISIRMYLFLIIYIPL